jgi:hypothetical protein
MSFEGFTWFLLVVSMHCTTTCALHNIITLSSTAHLHHHSHMPRSAAAFCLHPVILLLLTRSSMSDFQISIRMCANRQQRPAIVVGDIERQLQVDEQGQAVFRGFELPHMAGSYDLLVDAFINAGRRGYQR